MQGFFSLLCRTLLRKRVRLIILCRRIVALLFQIRLSVQRVCCQGIKTDNITNRIGTYCEILAGMQKRGCLRCRGILPPSLSGRNGRLLHAMKQPLSVKLIKKLKVRRIVVLLFRLLPIFILFQFAVYIQFFCRNGEELVFFLCTCCIIACTDKLVSCSPAFILSRRLLIYRVRLLHKYPSVPDHISAETQNRAHGHVRHGRLVGSLYRTNPPIWICLHVGVSH